MEKIHPNTHKNITTSHREQAVDDLRRKWLDNGFAMEPEDVKLLKKLPTLDAQEHYVRMLRKLN